MVSNQLKPLVDNSLGEGKPSGKEYLYDCPYCAKKIKLSIDFELGFFKCFVCEEAGVVPRLLKDQGIKTKEYEDFIQNVEHTTPNIPFGDYISQELGFVKVTSALSYQHRKAQQPSYTKIQEFLEKNTALMPVNSIQHRYLMNRGFTNADFLDFLPMAGIKELKNRVVIPVITNNSYVYYVARSILNFGSYKYKNPDSSIAKASEYIFVRRYSSSADCRIAVLCEGVFTAISAERFRNTKKSFEDVRGIALFGKTLSTSQMARIAVLQPEEIVLALDSGAWTPKNKFEKKKYKKFKLETVKEKILQFLPDVKISLLKLDDLGDNKDITDLKDSDYLRRFLSRSHLDDMEIVLSMLE